MSTSMNGLFCSDAFSSYYFAILNWLTRFQILPPPQAGIVCIGFVYLSKFCASTAQCSDFTCINWCICNLQRISIGYLLASISEIWLVNNITVDSPMKFLKKYYIQWLVLYIALIWTGVNYHMEALFSGRNSCILFYLACIYNNKQTYIKVWKSSVCEISILRSNLHKQLMLAFECIWTSYSTPSLFFLG